MLAARLLLVAVLGMLTPAAYGHGWSEQEPLQLKAAMIERVIEASQALQASVPEPDFTGAHAIAWQAWLTEALGLHIRNSRRQAVAILVEHGYQADTAIDQWSAQLDHLTQAREAARADIWNRELPTPAAGGENQDEYYRLLYLSEVTTAQAARYAPHFPALDALIAEARP